MSGHNRWSKIKRQKEAMGASKGRLFTKLIKEVTVAARLGGGDSNANARLRAAVTSARDANMPSDTIARAIKKGTGELEGVNYEEIQYEGYGPGGVAMIVECLTDNRNRTAGDVRAILSKGGGNLATEGAVSWMFGRKGVITVKPGPTEDQLMEQALEVGAEDVINHGPEGFEIRTDPASVHSIAADLEKKGVPVTGQRWNFFPQNTVKLESDPARKMLKLMEMLEDNDDVQNVYANFEIDEAIFQEMS
ncbi:MAG TPA: YebC/PmpR family DNA-binding transcriptional regulator [Myxococcaceae bacterium]|nr:YebC/PmpR family DNA-binding transcriptional regulator [Myxococcaceae bacterium]